MHALQSVHPLNASAPSFLLRGITGLFDQQNRTARRGALKFKKLRTVNYSQYKNLIFIKAINNSIFFVDLLLVICTKK